MKNLIVFIILMIVSFGCGQPNDSIHSSIMTQKVIVEKAELIGGIASPSMVKVTYNEGVVFLESKGDRNIPVGVPCTMVSIRNFSGMYIYFVKNVNNECENNEFEK